jgi:hypothetical protein
MPRFQMVHQEEAAMLDATNLRLLVRLHLASADPETPCMIVLTPRFLDEVKISIGMEK